MHGQNHIKCSVLFKEIVGVCGTYGKDKNANRFFVVKPDRKRTHGRLWHKLEIILKWTLKK